MSHSYISVVNNQLFCYKMSKYGCHAIIRLYKEWCNDMQKGIYNFVTTFTVIYVIYFQAFVDF